MEETFKFRALRQLKSFVRQIKKRTLLQIFIVFPIPFFHPFSSSSYDLNLQMKNYSPTPHEGIVHDTHLRFFFKKRKGLNYNVDGGFIYYVFVQHFDA